MPLPTPQPAAALSHTPQQTIPQQATPPQQVITFRRDYNSWVARETMEDYALRFTPRTFRK